MHSEVPEIWPDDVRTFDGVLEVKVGEVLESEQVVFVCVVIAEDGVNAVVDYAIRDSSEAFGREASALSLIHFPVCGIVIEYRLEHA